MVVLEKIVNNFFHRSRMKIIYFIDDKLEISIKYFFYKETNGSARKIVNNFSHETVHNE